MCTPLLSKRILVLGPIRIDNGCSTLPFYASGSSRIFASPCNIMLPHSPSIVARFESYLHGTDAE